MRLLPPDVGLLLGVEEGREELAQVLNVQQLIEGGSEVPAWIAKHTVSQNIDLCVYNNTMHITYI